MQFHSLVWELLKMDEVTLGVYKKPLVLGEGGLEHIG
jgi:hypothetical protein